MSACERPSDVAGKISLVVLTHNRRERVLETVSRLLALPERCPICVVDNASSDGLRNMRQRMEEIGGRLQIESQPGAGTRIAFTYPWPERHRTHGNTP